MTADTADFDRALVTAVQELGRLTGVQTPTVDAMQALTALKGRTAGVYG